MYFDKKNKFQFFCSGIVLNSLMSILSFNQWDFSLKLGKISEYDKQARMHRSKFWRQCVYNFVIMGINLW